MKDKTTKDVEKDIEEKIKKNIEKDIEQKVEKAVTRNAYKIGHVIGIICSLAGLYIVHNVTNWDHSFWDFINDDFDKIIWAIDLSFITGIIASLVKIFSNNKVYHKMGQVFDNIFSFILLVVSLSVFPYDFKELFDVSWINTAAKVFLWFLVIVLPMGTIAEVAKLISGKYSEEDCK